MALLADDEDKTRSNAAGALGNLVRNSNLLCGAMLRAGALEVFPLLRKWQAICVHLSELTASRMLVQANMAAETPA